MPEFHFRCVLKDGLFGGLGFYSGGLGFHSQPSSGFPTPRIPSPNPEICRFHPRPVTNTFVRTFNKPKPEIMQLRKGLLAVFTVISLSLTASAQIKAVEKFVNENEDLSKFFIYQSTLRMLNKNGDENFNKLIKGIRKINVYVSEGSAAVSTSSYQRMINELTAEKFETLVSAKTEGTLINLMSRESGNDAYYVLATSEGANFALMEMDGQLDLRYLEALENMNFTKLREIIGQDDNKSNSPEHTQD
jgi:hypothetical protein